MNDTETMNQIVKGLNVLSIKLKKDYKEIWQLINKRIRNTEDEELFAILDFAQDTIFQLRCSNRLKKVG